CSCYEHWGNLSSFTCQVSNRGEALHRLWRLVSSVRLRLLDVKEGVKRHHASHVSRFVTHRDAQYRAAGRIRRQTNSVFINVERVSVSANVTDSSIEIAGRFGEEGFRVAKPVGERNADHARSCYQASPRFINSHIFSLASRRCAAMNK